jgi:hypothetical protein
MALKTSKILGLVLASSGLFALDATAGLIIQVEEIGEDLRLTQTGSLNFENGSAHSFRHSSRLRTISGTAEEAAEDVEDSNLHTQIEDEAPAQSQITALDNTAFNSFTSTSRFVWFENEGRPDSGTFSVGGAFREEILIPDPIQHSLGLFVSYTSDLFVYVPEDLISGEQMSSSYTIPDYSFADAGLIFGQQAVWNLANGDSVTWRVGARDEPAPVPAQATATLSAVGSTDDSVPEPAPLSLPAVGPSANSVPAPSTIGLFAAGLLLLRRRLG